MRVVVLAGGDPGHVFPAAGLTRALVERGHEALFCTGGHWMEALERSGIPGRAMPHPPPNPEPDAVRRLKQTSRRLAPRIAETLEDFKPDLLVSDVMTPSGGLAAALLGVPWIEFVPHPVQDPTPLLPPSGSGFAPARGPLGRARDRRFFRYTGAQWEKGREGRRRDIARLELDAGRAALAGDGSPLTRIFAALPALEETRPDWPADAHLVGPIEWDPAAVDLEPPPGDGPLVLLSATTVTGAVTGLAAAAVHGLDGLRIDGHQVRLAWTVLAPPETGLPDWVRAGPGRQEPLIEQASLVICGGGHGILAKALSRGVPVVTVPGGGEQRENADRVKRSGLGERILPFMLTPARMRRKVRRVLEDPRYRARAEVCRPEPGSRGSGDLAVDVIERTMARFTAG
ncbi:glycosyltransferase [Spongisporangium articulatum]|uniref:Glycosyltransferase n=1 Tax=Spongisporangium articulatum TaxID=3362603 RepID=A0ABW8AKD0_9ACTN